MPGPLDDAREEQLAHLLAAGMDQTQAYGRAGWRGGDTSNASKKCREKHIVDRTAELRAEAAQLGIFGDEATISALGDQALVGATADESWAIHALMDWVKAAR